MVLSHAKGDARRRRVPRCGDDRGSQSVELALCLPFVMLAVTLVLHAGVLAADIVTARSVGMQAARLAAVDDDGAVRAAVRAAAGRRPVRVELEPPDHRRRAGDLVAATVRLRSRAFAPFGAALWVPSRVVMRVERP